MTILWRASDANVPFSTLCTLLERLGFEQRIRDSHHIFTKEGVAEMLNLQLLGSKAKP